MADKKRDPDPFPELPKRQFYKFTGMGVQPEDAPGFEPLDSTGGKSPPVAKAKSPALASLHEVAKEIHAVGAIDDAQMADFDKSCLTPDVVGYRPPNVGEHVVKPRTGRPPKHPDKPWVAEGISRALWYRRKKDGK